MIADLLTRTVTVRHASPSGRDAHGAPVLVETSNVVRGHVQPASGSSALAEGSGQIGTRAATLYALEPLTVDVDDVVDDGTDEWRVVLPPKPHTRPGTALVHHVTVPLAWSAPSPQLSPIPPAEDQWDSTEW